MRESDEEIELEKLSTTNKTGELLIKEPFGKLTDYEAKKSISQFEKNIKMHAAVENKECYQE